MKEMARNEYMKILAEFIDLMRDDVRTFADMDRLCLLLIKYDKGLIGGPKDGGMQ